MKKYLSAVSIVFFLFAFTACPFSKKKDNKKDDTADTSPTSCTINAASTHGTCPDSLLCNAVDNLCYDSTKFPETTLVTFPAALTKDTHALFTFSSSSPDASYLCSLDSEDFHVCTSPVSADVLEGDHSFQVTAVNADGFSDPTPSSVFWKVDATTPLLEIVSPLEGETTGPSGEVLFKSNDSTASYACSLDGVVVTCDPNQAILFSSLALGKHEVSITGTDLYGNTGTASRTWVVDGAGPVITIDSPLPKQILQKGKVDFVFHAEGDESTNIYLCRVDNSAFKVCASPAVYKLSAGTHQITVKGFDGYGNLGEESGVSFSVK